MNLICWLKGHNETWISQEFIKDNNHPKGYWRDGYIECLRCHKVGVWEQNFENTLKDWWENFWSDWGGFFTVIGMLVGIIALLFGIMCWASYNSCNAITTKMGLVHSYKIWEGCFVNYKEQWVPLEMFIKLLQ
jgi:hypothetical protein